MPRVSQWSHTQYKVPNSCCNLHTANPRPVIQHNHWAVTQHKQYVPCSCTSTCSRRVLAASHANLQHTRPAHCFCPAFSAPPPAAMLLWSLTQHTCLLLLLLLHLLLRCCRVCRKSIHSAARILLIAHAAPTLLLQPLLLRPTHSVAS